jgi:hypothetical protein
MSHAAPSRKVKGLDRMSRPLSPAPGGISNPTGNITTHTHFTDNIVRVGLNYQFH